MASRFWVGGDGTWDASSTTNWSASSGGSSGASVPGSADTVTLDGNGGAGTGLGGGPLITVNTSFTVATLTLGVTGGNFIGTLDFSVNNNSPTFTTQLSYTGSGTRGLKLGSGTFTFSGGNGGTVLDATTTTGLTLTKGTATVIFSGGGATAALGSGLTWPNISVTATTGKTTISTSGASDTFAITAGAFVKFGSNATFTIGIAPTWTGTSSTGIGLDSSSGSNGTTIAITSGNLSCVWCYVGKVTFSGGSPTAINSIASGAQSGITVTPPAGGTAYIIGG